MKDRIKKLYRNYINNTGLYNLYDNKAKKAKYKALVIYSNFAVKLFLKNRHVNNSKINSHSGFIESIELLKCLNHNQFTVDYVNYDEIYYLDYNNYDLVIDIADNLRKIENKNCLKIYYATSCHWLFYSKNINQRITSFYEREGILLRTDRPISQFENEKRADFITTFGNDSLKATFFQPYEKFINLNISVSKEVTIFNDTKRNKNKFIWFGGYGAFHKGLDLAINVFEKLKDKELIIIGNLDSNTEFAIWAKEKIKQNKNITYYGWITPNEPKFYELIKDCAAQIFPSSSEGGAGSVGQLMHFGILPIITESVCLNVPEHLCKIIKTNNVQDILNQLIDCVREVSEMSEIQLSELSYECFKYASTKFTIKSYHDSINNLLNIVSAKLR